MKFNKISAAILLSVTSMGAVHAQSDEVKFSAGLKAWNHSFKIKTTSPNGSGDGNSDFNATAPLVSLTAKKGDYFATYSSLMPTVYPLEGGDLKRSDTDIAVGWSFTPGYSVLFGHKSIDSKNFNNNTWNTPNSNDKGYFFGVTGAQMLQDKTFAYESFVYAPKMTNSDQTNAKITFTTLEAGVGYAIDAKTQLTVGYRAQIYDLKDDSIRYTQKVNLNGLIFGASVNF